MTIAMLMTMLLCFAFTVSIAVSIGLASLVGMQITGLNLLAAPKEIFSALNRFPLAAVPFFILAGNLMEGGGISRRLVDFAKSLVGGVQGGLPITCVVTCLIFAAVSGSSVATTFAIGAILIPALVKHGYPTPYAAALQATSAELGVIIPPSIPMIIFGVSAEVSIGELFIAGIGPGILIASTLILFVWLTCKWKGWGKRDGEGRLPMRVAAYDIVFIAGYIATLVLAKLLFEKDTIAVAAGFVYIGVVLSMRRTRQAIVKHAGMALLMPIIILGGIYGGIFTPTEASVVAVFYALFVGLVVYREISLSALYGIFKKSAISSGVILFIIANAGLFAYLITRAGVPESIGLYLGETLSSGLWFMLGVNVALFAIGMFIETTAAIIVLAPILVPVAIHFGIDPVHFGMVMIINLALGMITPPFGVNLFAVCTVAKIPLDRVIRPLVGFVGVILIGLVLITYFPSISLAIRDLVYR